MCFYSLSCHFVHKTHYVFKSNSMFRENNVGQCGLFHRATERVSQNHSSDLPHDSTRRDFAPFHGFNNEKIAFHVTTGRNQTIAKRVGLIMSSLTLFHRAAWMGPRWGRCICVLSFYHYTRNLLAIPFFHIPAASSTSDILCAA